jgi:hypothetical protein
MLVSKPNTLKFPQQEKRIKSTKLSILRTAVNHVAFPVGAGFHVAGFSSGAARCAAGDESVRQLCEILLSRRKDSMLIRKRVFPPRQSWFKTGNRKAIFLARLKPSIFSSQVTGIGSGRNPSGSRKIKSVVFHRESLRALGPSLPQLVPTNTKPAQ